jgi:hypothetical protein
MALFSRRVMRRMVEHLSHHLQPADLKKIVGAINRTDENSLSFEWELAVLVGLSKLGTIKYEASFGGKTYPDVHFQDKSGTSELVADITCVSDVGVITRSMIEVFEEEFISYTKEAKLNPYNFHIQIDGKLSGEYPNQSMTLLLPNRARMKRVMDEQLAPFLGAIKSREPSQISVDEADFKIVISYEPDRRSLGIGHPSFTTGYAQSENTLHYALENKHEQLNKSGYAGLKGIIVCDGGSDVLRSRHQWAGTFSAKDIIRAYVKKNLDLDFVMILRLEEDRFEGTNKKGVEGCLLRNDICGDAMSSSALDTILSLPDHIPKTDTNVQSARSVLRAGEGKVGASHFGGYKKMGDRQITIFARFLLELLAGKENADRYFIRPKFSSKEGEVEGENPFKRWSAEGRTIVNSSVELSEDEDDDWITLELGDPDPAISPIRRPRQRKQN